MLMNTEIWLIFCLASVLLLVTPGPTTILVMSMALVYGRRSVPPLVAGVNLGHVTMMLLSFGQLKIVLATSPELLTELRWIGAAYMIFQGLLILWRQPGGETTKHTVVTGSKIILFRRAYLVTALNPQSFVFFTAFLPQFFNCTEKSAVNVVFPGITFLCLSAGIATSYGLLAGRLHETVRNRKVWRYFNCCGGSVLICTGFVIIAVC